MIRAVSKALKIKWWGQQHDRSKITEFPYISVMHEPLTCSKLYTVSHKTWHFVFDYNTGVFRSIFMVFVPLETGRIRNTAQFTNCVTSHVTKVYFISYFLKLNRGLRWVWRQVEKLWKTCGNVMGFFLTEKLIKEFLTKK